MTSVEGGGRTARSFEALLASFRHKEAFGMAHVGGVGGAETQYSGSGESTRVAPNHTHFAMMNCSVQLDGQAIIENERLLMR